MRKNLVFIFLCILINAVYSQTKPNHIPDLKLWLRADSNYVLSGSNVTQWNDCSGNNNNASQPTSASRPLWINNTLNGKPVLNFDGANDFFDGNTIPNLNNSSLSIIIVTSGLTYNGSNASPLFGINCYPNQFYYSRSSMTQSINILNTSTYGNGLVSATNSLPNSGYSYQILEYTKNFNAISKIYINGTFSDSTTNSTQIGAFTNGNYYIGLGNGGCYTDYYHGDIAEIILYAHPLTNNERISIEQYLRLKYANQINLGPDIIINYGFKETIINAGSGLTNYLWKGGTTAQTLTVNKSGTYWVQANDLFGYLSKDTIKVTYPNTRLNYQNDTSICSGSNMQLKSVITKKNKYTFLWSNGTTDSVININTTGNYWVKITDTLGYFAYSDTIHITVDHFAQNVKLGNDTSFCSGNYIRIQPPLPNPQNLIYNWSGGTHDTTLVIIASGNYKVSVTNLFGCTGADSIHVTILGIAPNAFFKADSVCLGNPTLFTDLSTSQPGDPIVKWHWKFTTTDTSNLQNPLFIFGSQGIHNVVLTTYSAGGCSKAYNKNVLVYPKPTPAFSVNAACRNNPYQFIDLSSVLIGDTIANWNWNFGDATPHSNLQNPVHTYAHANSYLVSLTIQTVNGCQQSVSHILQVDSVSSLPSVPGIIYPANNAIISDTNIVFSWLPSQNAVRYKIIIASDNNFSSIITQNLIDTNQFQYNFAGVNQQIFWKVISYNICSDSTISGVLSFKIFFPDNLAGLNLWLRSDWGITKDINNYVTQWNDFSGNSHNAIQTVSASKPLWKNNTINGKPVLNFDGVNDFFDGNTIPNLNNSSLSIFIVTNGLTYNGINASPLFGINCYPNQFYFSRSSTTQSLNILNTGIYASGLMSATNSLPNSGFSYKILEYTKNFNLISKIYSNGTFLKQMTNGAQIGSFTNGNYYIGFGNSDCYTDYYHGNIAEIIVYNNVLSDPERINIENYLHFKYAGPPVNLGPDINLAYGMCGLSLDAGGRFSDFIWSTGDTTQTINITQSGQYSVTATNVFGELSKDTVNVSFPSIIIHDTAYCLGDTLVLSGNPVGSYSYLWLPDSVVSNTFTITRPGTYSLSVYDTSGCYRTQTFTVSADSFAVKASLGPDKKICKGDYLGLVNGAQQAASYLWSNGSGNSLLIINDALGSHPEYSVTVSSINGCLAIDTIHLTVNGIMPVAEFASDSVCLGNLTHFTNMSSVSPPFQIVNNNWNFDDASISTVVNPSHLYQADGYYEVTLTVVTDSGCVNSHMDTAVVFSNPAVNFLPYQGCSSVPISFTDHTLCPIGTINQWDWKFNDFVHPGFDTSTAKNPIYTFDSAGVYNVKVITVSNAGCIDSVEKTVKINKSPSVDFNYTNACAEHSVFFNDMIGLQPWETIISYNWQFGDGDFSSMPNPTHIFNIADIYTAVFTIRNSTGCEVSVTKPIDVGEVPTVDFLFSKNCILNATQFSDNSLLSNGNITSWYWNFDGLGSSVNQNPVFIFPDTSVYRVYLTVTTDHNCKDTASQLIQIMSAPDAQFSLAPEYGIPPLSVTMMNNSVDANYYLWSFGDSESSTLVNPVHTYQNQGIFRIMLNAFNAIGCTDTVSAMVYVLPTTVDIAVVNAEVNTVNGRLFVTADLSNEGTRKIEHIDMAVDFGNGNILHEQWLGSLLEGESLNYKFEVSSEIPRDGEVNYVCVKALLPDLFEERTANNIYCVAMKDEFIMLDPYPNPVKDMVNIAFILPFEDQVIIDMVDGMGKFAKEIYRGTGTEGYNSKLTDISALNSGVYTIRISFRDKILRKKFVKL